VTRVVVIGNGMAGARLVEHLLSRDPSLDVTVFGAEQRPAYNRVLLSDVLAGKRPAGDVTLASVARARRHLGAEVTRIDREAKVVHAEDLSAPASSCSGPSRTATRSPPGPSGPRGRSS
jgi:NAD(P)H-nitrite reductase large subunit